MFRKGFLFLLCALSLGGCGSTGTDILSSSLTRPASSSAGSSSSTVNRSLLVEQSALASKAEDGASTIKKKLAKKRVEKSQSANAMTGADAPVTAKIMNATTPDVGSPEWEKEKRENDRQERHLKQVIDGICQGC